MKKLLLKSMLLVSHVEKKALKIKFDPKVTIIQGDNDTGKSSVIKTLFWTFGAEPPKIHKNWKAADIISLVHFELDSQEYAIYRHRRSFSLFSGAGTLLGTYESVTNELGPALAELFGFNLKLTSRQGIQETPPPAYMLLPFYIDQDGGWSGTWGSFKSLGQYSNWKKTLKSYFLGLRPDEWYALDTQRKLLEQDKDDPIRQLNSIEAIARKTISEISSFDFNMDLVEFEKDVEELVRKCNLLKEAQDRYREKITELKTEEIRLSAQIEIVIRTRSELNADYVYSQSRLEDFVSCPTCGAEYINSFAERFSIAEDAETCTDLLVSLREDLLKTKSEIDSCQQSLKEEIKKKKEIDRILARENGSVAIKDIINIEGKKSLLNHLDYESGAIKDYIGRIGQQQLDIKRSMDRYDDPERRKAIIEEYGKRFYENARKLSVTSLSDHVFKNIDASIEESGSDLPRAVLAYYFAIISLITESDKSLVFPMVIDAPNQQEQDKDNLIKILNFIINSKPESNQMIVGLVDDARLKYPGARISFKTKYSALNSTHYLECSKELRPYEAIHLSGNS